MKMINKYRCKDCREIVVRKSCKQWIKSWCDATQRFVRLMRLDKAAKTKGK